MGLGSECSGGRTWLSALCVWATAAKCRNHSLRGSLAYTYPPLVLPTPFARMGGSMYIAEYDSAMGTSDLVTAPVRALEIDRAASSALPKWGMREVSRPRLFSAVEVSVYASAWRAPRAPEAFVKV